MRRSKRPNKQKEQPAGIQESDGFQPSRMEAAREQSPWFHPVSTYVIGVLYLFTALLSLLLSADEPIEIGVVCEEACGGTLLLGIALEWWGMMLMGGVLVARWLVVRHEPRPLMQVLAAMALGHAGASLAFAGSQWLGIAEVCTLCQVATLLSVLVAVTCLRVVAAAFEASLIPAAQSLVLGIVGVLAVWPWLQDADSGRTLANAAPRLAVNATSQTSPLIDQAMEALTLGDPDAPYELVVVTDFTCRICERFETQQLPTIVQDGVETGRIRVRFLLPQPMVLGGQPYHELVAVTSLAMAGLPAPEAFKLMRAGRLTSTPHGINRATDPQVRQQALGIVGEISAQGD